MSRILFVLDIGFDRGGPSVHLLQDILKAALQAGHNVDVILKDTGGPDDVMPDELASNTHLSYNAIREEEERKKGFIERYIAEIKYAYKCSKYFLNNGEYDVVFLQSNTVAYFYIRLLKKLNCRIVFNVQDIFPYNLKFSGQLPFEFITFPLLRKLQNMAYRKSDTIITISDDMKQTLVEDGVYKDNVVVIYNWSYDDSLITLESISAENVYDLKLDRSKFNIVYAGNIGKMQNVELIAETAKILSDDQTICFYIIGDGANKNNIEKMTNGLVSVKLLPMQPSKFAESIYAQADVNIIPLRTGGIKTALPSKTATILRTRKPVIFCVDENSSMEETLSCVEGVYFTNCAVPDNLVELIKKLKLQDLRNIDRTDNVLFQKNNAKKYVDVLVG